MKRRKKRRKSCAYALALAFLLCLLLPISGVCAEETPADIEETPADVEEVLAAPEKALRDADKAPTTAEEAPADTEEGVNSGPESATGKSTLKKSTIKELLLTGLEPVGSTMYVWGGGWNSADAQAGPEARTMGISPRWKAFFYEQDEDYDFRTTRYQSANGLDCSGYMGWCMYNIFNTESGNEGYVMPARKMAENFASRGWGFWRDKSRVSNYLAGDIMSSTGHVWMTVGQCEDGSVVLLHSSPPGVQLAGTPSHNGETDSQAVRLAAAYMEAYFPQWYARYPDCSVEEPYLTRYDQMRWDITGSSVMTDPDGYREMGAAEILEDLFAGSG